MTASIVFTAPAACGCLVPWTAHLSGVNEDRGCGTTTTAPAPCPTHDEMEK